MEAGGLTPKQSWYTFVYFRFVRSFMTATKLCACCSSGQTWRARAPNISHGPGLVGGARPGRLMLSARGLKSFSKTLQKGICLGVKGGGGYLVRVFEQGVVPQAARADEFEL